MIYRHINKTYVSVTPYRYGNDFVKNLWLAKNQTIMMGRDIIVTKGKLIFTGGKYG